MVDGNNSDRDKALAKIAEVRSRFVAGLGARLDALVDLTRRAAGQGAEASTSREELRIGLHNIAGSAPTLGLLEIGRRAAAIERRVIEGARPDGGLDARLADDVAGEIAALGAMPTDG